MPPFVQYYSIEPTTHNVDSKLVRMHMNDERGSILTPPPDKFTCTRMMPSGSQNGVTYAQGGSSMIDVGEEWICYYAPVYNRSKVLTGVIIGKRRKDDSYKFKPPKNSKSRRRVTASMAVQNELISSLG
jgi:hypothetical protein